MSKEKVNPQDVVVHKSKPTPTPKGKKNLACWKEGNSLCCQPIILAGGCLCLVGLPLLGVGALYMTGYNFSALFGPTLKTEYKAAFDPTVCEDPESFGLIANSETSNYYGCFYSITDSDGYEKRIPEGEGQLIDERGTLTGTWLDGQVTGTGEYTRPDGKFYEGPLVDGLMEGYGTLEDEESIFKGTFVKDKKQGWGQETYLSEGSIYNSYLGEFKNNQPAGFGVRRTAKAPPEDAEDVDAPENYIEGVRFGVYEKRSYAVANISTKSAKWLAKKSSFKKNIFQQHGQVLEIFAAKKVSHRGLKIYNEDFSFYKTTNSRLLKEAKKECAADNKKRWEEWDRKEKERLARVEANREKNTIHGTNEDGKVVASVDMGAVTSNIFEKEAEPVPVDCNTVKPKPYKAKHKKLDKKAFYSELKRLKVKTIDKNTAYLLFAEADKNKNRILDQKEFETFFLATRSLAPENFAKAKAINNLWKDYINKNTKVSLNYKWFVKRGIISDKKRSSKVQKSYMALLGDQNGSGTITSKEFTTYFLAFALRGELSEAQMIDAIKMIYNMDVQDVNAAKGEDSEE